jgi:hypothetical protein
VAKLIISRNAQVLQEVELGAGRTTIGRHPHNDVVITHQAVSAHHAAITSLGGAAVLEDLGSSNGTFVNTHRITHATLADRDRVTIATFQLEYVAGDSLPVPAQPSGGIEVMNGASAGKKIPLHKPLTTLGSPGVLVVVVTRQADGYYIAQVQGVAVGHLNDQAISRTPRLLRDGDALELTGTHMRFSATFR